MDLVHITTHPPFSTNYEKVVVRFYNSNTDLARVLALENKCEVTNGRQMSVLQDLMGDPLCRVRHFSAFSMLVAEVETEIVGVIRAGMKVVIRRGEGAKPVNLGVPIYARAGYLLGLRVCPAHRKMGIGFKLASRMEEWCKEQGAEFVYFATTKDNVGSLALFTKRLQYIPLRNPAILAHPVFIHSRPASPRIEFTKLSTEAATAFYRSFLSTHEFFPKDIDKVLENKLCAGTWVATLKADLYVGLCCGGSCRVSENLDSIEECFANCGQGRPRPNSWAILSLWKCNEIFKLQVKGVSLHKRTLAYMSRLVERSLPWWFRIPSVPNLFTSFGVQCMFGLQAEGPKGRDLLKSLCWHAHNIARESGCQVVMTEVGRSDPLKKCIPHWKMLSTDDDLWCVKHLPGSSAPIIEETRSVSDLESTSAKYQSDSIPTLFVDPRDV